MTNAFFLVLEPRLAGLTSHERTVLLVKGSAIKIGNAGRRRLNSLTLFVYSGLI